jgi:hypothetical protein
MNVSGQLHAPTALPPGKESAVLIDRNVGGTQSRSGRSGVEENLLALQGIEPGRLAGSLSLYQLS